MIEVGVVMARAELGHTADVKNLLADLATFKPTFILSVPRVFEKVYNSSEQKAEAAGKGKIFHAAADTAIAYSEALDHGGPGLGAAGQARRSSTSSSTASCAPRWADGCAGRSPAARRSARGSATSSAASGSRSLEGYGLTETTAASTVNTPGMIKIGTVGPTPARRLDPDRRRRRGARSRAARSSPGYYNNEAATAEALRDGWFSHRRHR